MIFFYIGNKLNQLLFSWFELIYLLPFNFLFSHSYPRLLLKLLQQALKTTENAPSILINNTKQLYCKAVPIWAPLFLKYLTLQRWACLLMTIGTNTPNSMLFSFRTKGCCCASPWVSFGSRVRYSLRFLRCQLLNNSTPLVCRADSCPTMMSP